MANVVLGHAIGRLREHVLDEPELDTSVFGFGRRAGPAVHIPDLIRDAGGARDLAIPLTIGAGANRYAVLAFDDSALALSKRHALKKREEERIVGQHETGRRAVLRRLETKFPSWDILPAELSDPHFTGTVVFGMGRIEHSGPVLADDVTLAQTHFKLSGDADCHVQCTISRDKAALAEINRSAHERTRVRISHFLGASGALREPRLS